ncbi:MAG: hypothetical protein R2830_16520 [Saprospiraceae bacterium]
MKKSTLLTEVFVFLFFTASFATTWRVNNNANINANFTTLQAAVTGAATGDTLIVEPSSTSYGTATITKKLTIIGNGSFLSNYPGLQFNNNGSIVNSLTFQAGSQNSFITGISALEIFIQTTNITVHRCRVEGGYIIVNASNSIVSESWMGSGSGIYVQTNNLTNLYFQNNVIINGLIIITSNSLSLIENNVVGGQASGYISLNNSNSVLRNNILTSTSTSNLLDAGNADIQNNISGSNSLPTGNGNQNSVSMSNVFVTWPFSGTNDSHPQLKAGSPAIDAGFYGNGDDIGAYNDGTNRPSYVPALIPPFPTIYALSVGGGGNNTTLDVTISTRSNN